MPWRRVTMLYSVTSRLSRACVVLGRRRPDPRRTMLYPVEAVPIFIGQRCTRMVSSRRDRTTSSPGDRMALSCEDRMMRYLVSAIPTFAGWRCTWVASSCEDWTTWYLVGAISTSVGWSCTWVTPSHEDRAARYLVGTIPRIGMVLYLGGVARYVDLEAVVAVHSG